jgi:hypothetical protein
MIIGTRKALASYGRKNRTAGFAGESPRWVSFVAEWGFRPVSRYFGNPSEAITYAHA